MPLIKIEEQIKPEANPLGRLLESNAGKIRREIKVIASGWGSSGYYSESMLKEEGPSVFPAGTHMYMDHPTKSEERERPERSVKDLAAVFEEDARWSSAAGGLVTTAEIFPTWQESLTHEGFVNAIGTSIVAYGESEHGEAEGREGPLIKLTQGLSTDFVTHAGAGGEVGALIEAARKNAGWPISVDEARNANDWLAAYIHSTFTSETDYLFGEGYLTRDERIALSGAIGDALDAFNAFVEKNVPQLMTRDPYGDPSSPVSIESTRPDKGEEDTMDQETKDRLDALEKRADTAEERAKKAEEERDELRTENEREKDKRLIAKAKEVATEAVKSVKGLPEKAVERAIKDAYDPASLPLDSDGDLIEERIKSDAIKAAEAEKQYLTEGSDKGRVRGNGRVTESNDDDEGSFADLGLEPEEEDEEVTEATGSLAGVFGELGMSEAAAKTAAEGR